MKKFVFKTIDNMVSKFNEVHGDNYSYNRISSYIPNQKIEIECNNCNDIFKISATLHYNKFGCIKCQSNDDTIYNELYKDKISNLIDKFKSIHGDRYMYDNIVFQSTESSVDITCKIHGKFSQRIFDHMNGANCPLCGINNRRDKLLSTIDEFINKANKIHKFKYDYNKSIYLGNSTKVIIVCNKHGEFSQTPTNHIDKKSGCPSCKNKWRSQDYWLDSLLLFPDGPEYRQVKLKDDGIINGKKKLVADGYDPATNTIYEFLGDYHHGNPKLYDTANLFHCFNKQPLILLHDKTITRFNYLYNKGYSINYIWENQFKNNTAKYHSFMPDIPIIYT